MAENDAGAAETTVKNGKTEGGDAAAAAGEVAEGDEGKDDEEPKKLTDEEALQKVRTETWGGRIEEGGL